MRLRLCLMQDARSAINGKDAEVPFSFPSDRCVRAGILMIWEFMRLLAIFRSILRFGTILQDAFIEKYKQAIAAIDELLINRGVPPHYPARDFIP